jgi:hypothetical protein
VAAPEQQEQHATERNADDTDHHPRPAGEDRDRSRDDLEEAVQLEADEGHDHRDHTDEREEVR